MCLPPAELFANSIWLWAFWLFHALKARKSNKKTPYTIFTIIYCTHFFTLDSHIRTKQLKKVVKCNQSLSNSLNPVRTRINTFASTKTETDICWWTLSLFTYAALWTASSELNRKWIKWKKHTRPGRGHQMSGGSVLKPGQTAPSHSRASNNDLIDICKVSLSVSWHSSSGHGNNKTSLNSQITI